MPQTSSNEHAQPAVKKSTAKKTVKASRDSILDDAPLFAGLDGFCLNQSTGKNAEPLQADTEREKKKTIGRLAKQASPLQPPAPKARKTPSPESGDVLLSVAEMCALLKISRATLIRLDKSGRIPGRIKLGGSVRFHRATVDSWLQSLISTNTGV